MLKYLGKFALYCFASFLIVIFYYFIFFNSMLMVEATAVNWTGGGGDGKWETPANWSTAQVPSSTDQVTISGATVTLSAGQTANFSSLTIGSTAAELILIGNIGIGGSINVATSGVFTQQNAVQQSISGTFTVQSTGAVRHTTNTSTQRYIVSIAANAIDIQSGSRVYADGLGFSSNVSGPGNGPGAGSGNSFGGAGGAHGGNGANGGSPPVSTNPGGISYCDVTNLTTMGSGGGGTTGGGGGGNGGGLINLAASSTITINGSVSATGTPATLTWYGGGAGGGIRLVAPTIAGTPSTFSVAGGVGGAGGGSGGGGCVQISYTTANSISPTASYFSLTGGVGGAQNGGAGVAFIKNTSNGTSGDLFAINSSATFVSTTLPLSITLDTLTINTTSIVIVSSTKTLTMNSTTPFAGDNTGKLVVKGTLVATSGTLFTGVGLDFYFGGGAFNNPTNLTVSSTNFFGPATFINPINVFTISGRTTTLFAFTSTTALQVDSMVINNRGRLTHLANTSAQTHILNVHATTTISILSGGAINVDGAGFSASNGPGPGLTNGLSGGGGAHGGNGSLGLSANTTGGIGYCAPDNVATMGSGGGGTNAPGLGGGLVILSASTSISINGSISANGVVTALTSWQSGGGGGGVVLNSPIITGSPSSITVTGGPGGTGSGSGGGGCIQINYSTSNIISPTSSFVSVAGGAGGLSVGGSGFVFIKNSSNGSNGDLYLNNSTINGATTTLANTFTADSITMTTSSLLIVSSTKTFTLTSARPFGGDGTGRILFNGTLNLTNTTTISNITLDFSSGGFFTNSSTITASSAFLFGPSTLANPLISFIISGGTTTLFSFTTTTALNVDTLVLNNGGHLTHAANATTQTSVINVHATSSITMNAGSFINVDGVGYTGGAPLGNGNGPGGGIGTSTLHGAGGAGHGGAGGAGSSAAGGAAYCNISNVSTIGSGGGSGASGFSGSSGGGLVILNTPGALTLNGIISAKGSVNTSVWNGGGAGGGVKLNADTISGTPTTIDVRGGAGTGGGGGGGGGGCIQSTYLTASSLTVAMVTTTGGSGNVVGADGLFAQNVQPHNVAPGSVVTSTLGTTSIGISWTWGGGTETRYGVERSTDGIVYTPFSVVSPSSTVTASVTGLSINTRYWFRVNAGDGALATSSYTTSSPVYTLASTPTAFSGVANSASQITLTWTGTATNYFVTNTTAGTTSGWISSTTTAFSGLTCGTTYSFLVKGRNGDAVDTSATSTSVATQGCANNNNSGGSSPPLENNDPVVVPPTSSVPVVTSTPVATSTPAATTTPESSGSPPIIDSVRVVNLPEEVRLTWNVVAENGLAQLYVSYGTSPSYGAAVTAIGGNFVDLPNLLPNTEYFFQIAAVDFKNNTALQTGRFVTNAQARIATTTAVVTAPLVTHTNNPSASPSRTPAQFPATNSGVGTIHTTPTPGTAASAAVDISTGTFNPSAVILASASDALGQLLSEQDKTILSTRVAPAITAITLAVTLAFVSWADIVSLLRYLFLQPSLLLSSRRRKGWGQVYNSLNKQPLDLVTVRLINASTNRIVQTRVTDQHGRYAFLAQPGAYYVFVVKPAYSFPSKLLEGFTDDGQHTDVYLGAKITVNEQNAAVTVNIPLDPVGATSKPKRLYWQAVARTAQITLSFAGLAIVMGTLLVTPQWYMYVLAVAHIALILAFERLALPKKIKSWGLIYDARTKAPVGRAIARLFNVQFNKLVETQITDSRGRYNFLAGDSRYTVSYEHPAYVAIQSRLIDLSAKPETTITFDVGLQAKPVADGQNS